MISLKFRTWLVLGMCVAALGQATSAADLDEERAAMNTVLRGAAPLFSPGRAIARETPTLQALYGSRNEQLLWSHDGIVSRQALQLATLMHEADRYGLVPTDYGNDTLGNEVSALSSAQHLGPIELARMDVSLSLNLLRFVSHLHFGRIDPSTAGFELTPRAPLDLAKMVAMLAVADNVAAVLEAIEPTFYHYPLLKRALLQYRTLAAGTLVTALTPLPHHALRGGDSYAGATDLRQLLTALGDMPALDGAVSKDDENRIDPTLMEAIKRFQARHGFLPDGMINSQVFAALTTPMSQRVRQIELTLERWRWLPPFETPPIIVNIPEFRLFAFQTVEDRVATLTQMDVIVGESYPRAQTPVFLGDLRYVVFRPYWDIPRSITLREMLPKIRAHTDYLTTHHLEIVRGQSDAATIVEPSVAAVAALAAGSLRLRQQPGDANALGLIKFIFPNAHNVYLHSTPSRALFLRSERAFSHGCIRVSDPDGLAEFVLHNAAGDWDRAHIEAAMQGANARRVELITPIPVMILYATAQATEAGPVQFFEDIYGHDRQLETLLSEAKRSPPPANEVGRAAAAAISVH